MRRLSLVLLCLLVFPNVACAQEEIVVTAQKRSDDVPQTSGVGIRRAADFVVQRITVYGDTRDKEARRREILQTVRNVIDLGQKRGVQVSYGAALIQPLTLSNYRDKLTFSEDEDRNDAEEVSFIIKTPLADGNAYAATDRLITFLKAVPLDGRAVIQHEEEPGVSIVEPNKYRVQIIAAIAADANAAAKQFGPDYAAEVDNLATPVRWVLTGPTEVLLYLDHTLKVMPKN